MVTSCHLARRHFMEDLNLRIKSTDHKEIQAAVRSHQLYISQYGSLAVSSPLCILELSTLTRIEKAVKNTTIIVIYRVLVYIQMSQPTTCFGLFWLGHIQVSNLKMA